MVDLEVAEIKSRRGFLKASALVAGSLVVADALDKVSKVTTPTLAIARTAAYVLINRRVQGDLMPEDKLYDPIEKRPFPTDLANDPRIEKIVQEDFGGQDGVVGYAQFAAELSQQPIKLISEAHLDWAEKVAHREIWTADWVANPEREMIVGMGRFTPEDNEALRKFASKDLTASEDQALKILVEGSSLTRWIGDDFLEGESFGVEFGKGLRLLRRLGATIVGTSADRPPITSDLNQYYQDHPDIERAEIEQREQKAAEILFDLERKHPKATIYGMAGRDHIQRGLKGEGITPKLEVMHAQEPVLRERRVTAVSFGSIMGDTAGFYTDVLEKFGLFPQNSVLVVRNPAFGAVKWVQDSRDQGSSVHLDWAWPKPDFFVARILYHPLS